MNFDGKTVLVTGAARGIGAQIASAFHAAGAYVVITDVLAETGKVLAAKLGSRALFIEQDVREEARWEAVTAEAVAWGGGLDALVNNAGIEAAMPVADLDVDLARRMIDINFVGVLLGVKWGLRTMRPGGAAGKGGAIVNLSSISAKAAGGGMAAYAGTKAAVERLTKVAAVEAGTAGYNVRVNCLYPGIIQTDMIDHLADECVAHGWFQDREAVLSFFKNKTPLRRLGRPEDVANVTLFLCSDLASFVTGAGVSVDGGFLYG